MPDWTQWLAYLAIAAAFAGMVALSRTGKPRLGMPENSRTGKRLDWKATNALERVRG